MTIPAFLLGPRAAIAALLLGVAGVVALAILGFHFAFGASDAPAETRLHQLALLRAQAAARPQVERSLAALRAQADAHPSLLRGESDAITQATLQSDVKSIVEAEGGEVRSAFALPTTAENGLSLISVQYDITLPVTKLRRLAYDIESRLPYLFLSSVEVGGAQSWPTDAKGPEPRVEIRWTVSGYRRSATK